MPPEYDSRSPILFSYIVDSVIRYINDTGRTPYIACNIAMLPDWLQEFGDKGFINLNLAHRATEGSYMLTPDNYLYFRCRFHGAPRELWVPIEAVVVAFCQEDPTIGYQNNGGFTVKRNHDDPVKPKVTVTKHFGDVSDTQTFVDVGQDAEKPLEKKKEGNVTHVQFGKKTD